MLHIEAVVPLHYHNLHKLLVLQPLKRLDCKDGYLKTTVFYLYLHCPFVVTGHSNARDDGGGMAERGEEGVERREEKKLGRNVG